jgi:hypothetical protein
MLAVEEVHNALNYALETRERKMQSIAVTYGLVVPMSHPRSVIPAAEIAFHPVSLRINSPRNDTGQS